MTPEQLVDQLKQARLEALRSVVLYGSAAAGDFVPKTSNYNVLVVVDRLGLAELDTLSKLALRWAREGNRPPLLFTPAELQRSADSFPIELLDIRQSHRVLYGEDPTVNVNADRAHLRLQLERELKEKLLALREGYLLAAGRPRPILRLLTSSVAGLLVLFRAALRLFQEDVPAGKLDALRLLAERIPFDPQPFVEVDDLKHRRRRARGVAASALFESCLKTVEEVVEAIERDLHPGAKEVPKVDFGTE